MNAIGQFRARTVDGAGNADLAVFGQRPAVEDDHVVAAVDARLDVGGFHAGSFVMQLDVLAEGLAGHIHARIHLVPGIDPRLQAAFEHRDIAVAVPGKRGRRAFGQALAAVGHHDARRTARHQHGHADLELGQRHRGGQEHMPLGEHAFFPDIEQRDFAAVVEHALQGCRIDDALNHGPLLVKAGNTLGRDARGAIRHPLAA